METRNSGAGGERLGGAGEGCFLPISRPWRRWDGATPFFERGLSFDPGLIFNIDQSSFQARPDKNTPKSTLDSFSGKSLNQLLAPVISVYLFIFPFGDYRNSPYSQCYPPAPPPALAAALTVSVA